MSTEQAGNISTLEKWGYRCEPLDGFHAFETTLNRPGEEHWELVTVVINTTGMVYPVFKRPKLYTNDSRRIASRVEVRPPG